MTLILGVLIVLVGVGVVLVGSEQARQSEANDRLVEYLSSGGELGFDDTDDFQARLQASFLSRVLRPVAGTLNATVARLLPGNPRERAAELLARAGLAGRFRPDDVVTGQMVGAVLGLALGGLIVLLHPFTTTANWAFFLLLPIVGGVLPTLVLRRLANQRQDGIRRDLPDILDLLAISVEAGVGFEGAVRVVCERFDSPLAEELERMLREMELGVSRRDALQNLRSRTEVPEFSAVVVALIQADTLGMSVGHVLKLQAGEMRTKRRQWAREKAGKLPVKILFPLMFCIFPGVLVVVLGPAGSKILDAFK